MSEAKYLELIDIYKQTGNTEGRVKAMEALKGFRSQGESLDHTTPFRPGTKEKLGPEKHQQLLEGREAQLSIYPEGSRPTISSAAREQNALSKLRAEAPKSAVFARDLQEIGAAPELREMSVDSMRRGFAAGLITNEAELANAIKSLTPGAQVLQDPEGNALVKFPSGKTFAVNKPGLSGQDFVQFATRMLSFLPSAKIAGTTAKQLGKTSLAGAGTESALQLGETTVGGEFSPGEVAIAAGAAPAGQVVAEKVISPLLSGSKNALSSTIAKGKEAITNFTKSTEDMSEEGAAILLADAMVREGMTPEQVLKQLEALGPEAVPADIGAAFTRLLKDASNKIPRIEGAAKKALDKRQAGQGNRLIGAFEDASGTPMFNAKDEIARIETSLAPEINKLYSLAKEKEFIPSKPLKTLIFGDNDLSKAMKQAQSSLNNRRAMGEKITNVDVLDATKRNLDDQIGKAIRQGEKNKARDLIKLKNFMVDEIDKSIPVYKQARDMFAGKAQLEQAAESGDLFFKMKPSEVKDFIKSASESEIKMYKLGAKQALIDKIDTMQITHDAVKRLFGKGGDAEKLKSLFDSKSAFDAFTETMEREANFVMTRRIAQGGSSTAMQMFDANASSQALASVRTAIGDPVAAVDLLNMIATGVSKKKGSAAYIMALEKAGDILLESGMQPSKIMGILRRGAPKEVERIVKQKLKTGKLPAAITAVSVTAEEE